MRSPLHLSLEQVGDHLPAGNARGSPQSREVKSAREGIGIAEEKHGRNPAAGVLERKARRVHLVLLNLAAAEVVDGTGRVDFGLVRTGDVGELSALEDVEVVICGVAASVSFSSNGGA